MKRREIISFAAGLVLGLLVGLGVLASSEDLRDELFGTAGDDDEQQSDASAGEDLVYFQIDLATAQEWLVSQYEDDDNVDTDELTTAFTTVTDVVSKPAFYDASQPEEYEEYTAVGEEGVGDDVELLLQTLYDGLRTDDDSDAPPPEDSDMQVCLVLDESGYELDTKVLITIPAAQSQDVVPDSPDWELLPRYPMRVYELTCYPTDVPERADQ
ncbi:MAG: hypothetical protein GYB65_23470 [Chloroflexi bacterium]|nr:hypothetical protein [Chloroflexota bacterium]